MRTRTRDAFLFLCATVFSVTCLSSVADAASPGTQRAKPASQAARPAAAPTPAGVRKIVAASPRRDSGPVLQCVTFARDVSGVHLSGNALSWWQNAAGRFDRGQRPEVGAVLNFRASGSMRLGHLSVVSRVLSPREILVDDANWAGPGQRKGMIRRGASVIDVSPNNDWTVVRVANGIGSWGREYPTYGFIYARADRSVVSERIEIAAERDLPAATTPAGSNRGEPRGRATVASADASSWVWQGSTGVHANDAPASRQALGLPSPQMLRAGTAPTRWSWVNGQAVALD